MRKYLLAAAATLVVATPAAARDGSGYFGIEGGVMFPKDEDAFLDATFTQGAQTPAVGSPAGTTGFLVGAAPAAPGPIVGGASLDYKRGWDIDAIAGYDFGLFRLEGEIGYKRSKIDDIEIDGGFITGIGAALDPTGNTGNPPLFDDVELDLSDRVTVLSGMVNALLDFGDQDGVSFYGGGGFGRARVKLLGESDSAWAWQGIAGVRFALSPNIDLGLKYRYFRTGSLDFGTGDATLASTITVPVANTGTGATGTTPVTFVRTATLSGGFDDHFSSHSLLASLIFNFGGTEAAPPPPPPPPAPPPPPPPPATQTCPDGSVILATEVCPAPPPPPPPPPPAPERG